MPIATKQTKLSKNADLSKIILGNQRSRYGRYAPEYGEGPHGLDRRGEAPHLDTGGMDKKRDRPADPADLQAVGYAPDEKPKAPEQYRDLPVHEEKSGQKGAWNAALMEPQPNSVYIVDKRYLYVTDEQARVVHAEGWVGWLDPEHNDERRNSGAQRRAGGKERQWFDHGGHIFAASLNGPGESLNLTGQTSSQNVSQLGATLDNNWGRLEEHWKQLRAEGTRVHASVEIKYPASGEHPRPIQRAVAVRHSGKAEPLRVYKERPRNSAGTSWQDYHRAQLAARRQDVKTRKVQPGRASPRRVKADALPTEANGRGLWAPPELTRFLNGAVPPRHCHDTKNGRPAPQHAVPANGGGNGGRRAGGRRKADAVDHSR